MSSRFVKIAAVAAVLFVFTTIQGNQRIPSNTDRLLTVLGSPVFEGSIRKQMICEITAYCPGACCNTAVTARADGSTEIKNWANMIAAGNVTIDQLQKAGIGVAAVDISVIPYGSIIKYNGKLYAALDCGGLIKGNRIDIAMENHAESNVFGRRNGQNVEVFVPTQPARSVAVILESSFL